MRALVLAGGSGTRLRPWTPTLPKPLAPVANRPVVGWVLDHLDSAEDIDEIGVVVTPGQVDLYATILGNYSAAGRPVHWLTEPEPLGTGGALRHQRDFVGDDPVVVVPGDIICPVDLDGAIAHHRALHPAVTVAVTPRKLTVWDGDIVLVDDTGRAMAYLFKPGRNAPSNLGSTGTWVVEPALIDSLPEGFLDFSSDVLPSLSGRLAAYDTGEVYLRDVGTPESLLAGNHEAITGMAPLPRLSRDGAASVELGAVIEPGARVTGTVLLGQGARVCDGAYVCGPTVIGPDAVIEIGAHVEAAVVLPGAVVRGHVLASVVGDPNRALEVLIASAQEGRYP